MSTSKFNEIYNPHRSASSTISHRSFFDLESKKVSNGFLLIDRDGDGFASNNFSYNDEFADDNASNKVDQFNEFNELEEGFIRNDIPEVLCSACRAYHAKNICPYIYFMKSWRKKINSFNGGKKRIKSKEVDINSQKKAYVPSLTVAILEQCCMENGLIASESATTSDKKFSQKINNNIKNDASLVTRKYQLSIENINENSHQHSYIESSDSFLNYLPFAKDWKIHSREILVLGTDYSLLIGPGYEPLELIRDNEYCSITAGYKGLEESEEEFYGHLLKELKKFGTVMDIIKFDHKLRANCECIIQMNSKEAAVNAVNSDKLRQYPFLVEPFLGRGNKIFLTSRVPKPDITLECMWSTNPISMQNENCCKTGDAIINKAHSKNYMKAMNCKYKISSYISDVVKNENLLNGKKIVYPDLIDPVDIQIVNKGKAKIKFASFELGQYISNSVLSKMQTFPLILDYNDSVSMRKIYAIKMECPEELFELIKNDLRQIKSQNTGSFQLQWYFANRLCYLSIISNKYEDAIIGKTSIERIIDGKKIDCTNQEQKSLYYHRLLTRRGRKFLKKLKDAFVNRTIIDVNLYKKEVHIRGSPKYVNKIKQEIDYFIDHFVDNSSAAICSKKISLNSQTAPGLFKTLLNRGGSRFLEMEISSDAIFQILLETQELLFIGTSKQLEELMLILQDLRLEENRDPLLSKECIICFDSLDEEWHRLDSCGHFACKSCVYEQVMNQARLNQLPIACLECETLFSLRDIELIMLDGMRKGILEDSEKLKPLTDAALSHFLNKNSDKYHRCLVPSCPGIFEVKDKAIVVSCPFCKSMQCGKCGFEPHGKFPCEQFVWTRSNIETPILQWMKLDRKNRKCCPKITCHAVIEKQAGCNHMLCCICNTHFCWLCDVICEHLRTYHCGDTGLVDRDIEELYPNERWGTDFVSLDEFGPRFLNDYEFDSPVEENQEHFSQTNEFDTEDSNFPFFSNIL